MDTNTQIERLVELAIIQRSELKRLVDELPLLKEHLSSEIERTFEEAEPQLRVELEEWTTKQTADKTAALGAALESKIANLAKSLEESAQAKFSAVLAARDQNAELLKQAEDRIAAAAGELPAKVKEIVTAELARFPRAGEIDRLRKEFQEPRGLNPRGKWLPDQTYNKLDLVTWNGDSYVSNTDDNKERPGRNAANWTLSAARGTSGGGPADLSALTAVPSNGTLLIGSGTSWVNGQLSAGAGISITVGPGAITISATDGDITLDDGTAASPSLHFTNDPDTGIYRSAANRLGISTSGVQRMYVDEDGITTVGAGGTFDGSVHAANGNANNPSFSFTSDQDTGFYRHGTNELGISIGGTQKAVMTSTTFTVTPNLVSSGTTTMTGAASGSTLSLSGNATIADTILGTSGPSVKSSLSARAPRQGLVFDGSTAADCSGTSALGTGDFSASAVVSTASSAQQYIFLGVGSGGFGFRVNNYALEVAPYGAGSLGASSSSLTSGKPAHVAYVRSVPTGTFYINGVAAGTVTDSTNYSYASGVNRLGAVSSGTANLAGTILAPAIYNRVLSASEVVALYEAGAPSGADYNTAGLIYSTDFSSSTGWTLDAGATISGDKLNLPDNKYAGAPSPVALVIGKRYRFTVTVDSLTAGNVSYYNGSAYVSFATGAGTYTVEFTAAGSYALFLLKSVGGNAVCDTFSFSNVGLLLAPDAAQAGGGYVWNDQSGNLAQIVLPSSGVQWNLPSVAGQRIRGTTSTNGNQQLLGASVLLPAECQITHVRARARSGTPTITIGTASGGAQIVASVALSTTWLNCTIALTGGIVSSADDIWVGSNSTDVVETDIAFQPLDF